MNCHSEILMRQTSGNTAPCRQSARNNSLFEICVPAELSYISVARRAIEVMGEQLGLSPDDRSALLLAVGEACNNAVQYGSFQGAFRDESEQHSSLQKISLICRLDTEYIEIDVINEGNGFYPKPGDYTMPAAESMAESGRGLALIKLMMDSVEYIAGDNKHTVRMRKRFVPGMGTGESASEMRQKP